MFCYFKGHQMVAAPHALRTDAALHRIHMFLSRIPMQAKTKETSETTDPSRMSQIFDRLPRVGEFFLAQDTNKNKIFWTSNGKNYKSTPLLANQISQILEGFGDIPLTVINAAGDKFYVSSLSNSLIEKLKRNAQRSGLSEAQSVFKDNSMEYIYSLREVPDSNLLILTAFGMGDFLLPLRRALMAWAGICLLVLSIGLFFQYFLVSKLSEPLSELIQFFRSISLGQKPFAISNQLNELRPVFDGAMHMQRAIQSREQRLHYLASGLESILMLGKNESERDSDDSAQRPQNLEMCRDFMRVFLEFLPHARVFRPIFLPSGAKVASVLQKSDSSHWEQELLGSLEDSFGVDFGKVDFDSNDMSDFRIKMSDKPYFPELYTNEKTFHWDHPDAHSRAISFGLLNIKIYALRAPWGQLIVPFAVPVPFHQHSEFLELLRIAIDTLQNLVVKHLTNELKTQDEVIRKEISFAQKIHEKCIDLIVDPLNGLEVSTAFCPANKVGGDWIGVYCHKATNLVHFYLGDVTGHGLDSAFLVSLISGAVKLSERELQSGLIIEPASVEELTINFLQRVYLNLNALVVDTSSSLLMTLGAGVLDVTSGKVYYLSAGHPLPVLLGGKAGVSRVFKAVQVNPLGAWKPENGAVSIHTNQMIRGETLLLYTDGLLENRDSDKGGMRTRKDLKSFESILASAESNFESYAHGLMKWSMDQSTVKETRDDVAILALRWKGIA